MKDTVDTIAAIEDTSARAAKAAERARSITAALNEHRTRRNMAMLALLHEPYNWTKMRVIRHVGVSRTMFVRVVAKEPARLPEIRGDAAKVATREHEKVQLLEAEQEALLAIRDAAITEMLFDQRMPNHTVAEITGEHQVRIAQLRTGALAGV